MIRMWQGASGLAKKDGLVSPAYVVLAPKAKIDPRYASYLFKSQRMTHRFWDLKHHNTARTSTGCWTAICRNGRP